MNENARPSKEATYKLIELAKRGDEEAKDRLFEENKGLVLKLASRFDTSQYDVEDIIQIGYIGLLKAIYNFKPEFGVMFSTYAVPSIIGEIKRFFRENGSIKASRTLKRDILYMKKAENEFFQKYGYTPKLSQLAEQMGISLERMAEIANAAVSVNNITSLDDSEDGEYIASLPSEASPEEKIDNMVLKEEIRKLPERERKIILLRFFKDMTQQEIAKIEGISQVQVSRIIKKTLTVIRDNML